MGDIMTIGLDLAKNVFQFHAADQAGNVVARICVYRRESGSTPGVGYISTAPMPCTAERAALVTQ